MKKQSHFLLKKIGKIFLFILVFSTILFTSSCNTTGTRYKDRQYNNKILSKEACVAEIKHLLQVDEIYYFDCDFSNIPDIEIVDSSFNISVIGTFLNDDATGKQILDLTKQAEVFIVANYKIQSEGKCIGFSIVSSVMSPGMKHYKNDVLEYETQNEVYDSTTFTAFSELKGDNGNGTIYGSNNTIYEIEVPNNFYDFDLSTSLNPISYYRKYSGSLYDIKVLHTPLWVVTHYENYENFKDDELFSTMERIKSYLNKNALYTKK